MNTKKTGFMWFVIAIVLIGAYGSVNFISQNISVITSGENVNVAISGILSLIWLLIAIKYLIALFQCKKNVFLWTNIYFGFGLLEGIVGAYIAYTVIDAKVAILIPIILFFIIRIAIWVTFYKHLEKSQASGVIVLN